MKHYGVIFASALFCVLGAQSSLAYQADNASTETLWKIPDQAARVEADKKRRGEYYANRIKFFLEENQTSMTQGGVVFVGDSITNRFPIAEAFAGKSVYNRGIGGDRIEGVLERLDCSVIALKPREIHVMIGTNDVLWPVDYRNGELGPGYIRLFNSLKSVAPQAKIIAYTVLPIDKKQDRLGTCVKDAKTANEQLRKVCSEMKIELKDTYSVCANGEGNFRPGLSVDGVHLSLAGYLNWLELILNSSEEKFDVWKNLAPLWAQTGADTCEISRKNAYRSLNTLILYCKDKNTTLTSTCTNQWGLEVLVENDTVTSVSTKGNMPLPPAPGYVLSAVGNQREWLASHAFVGTKLKLVNNAKAVTVVTSEPKNAEEWYARLRGKMLTKMASCKNEAELAKLKPYMSALNEVKNGQGDPSQWKSLSQKLN